MRKDVQLCLAANNILLTRKWSNSPSYGRSCVKMADRFQSTEKQTQWANDKTIVELGYRKVLRYFAPPRPITVIVSVSQINYLK